MTRLREGFTTGTAATAAAVAAVVRVLGGQTLDSVLTPLPPFTGIPVRPTDWLSIPIQRVWGLCAAHAVVQKDAGDDPDVTHRAHIVATVWKDPQATHEPNSIAIEGGRGVGRVTLPGLPVPVGAPAINPVPQAQIRFALRLYAAHYGYMGPLRVRISVPLGIQLAQRTFNPRLGIVGGISILGTQGTVKAFSHSAWKTAVLQAVDVAVATQCHTLCLSTGRRSEKLLRTCYPHLSAQAHIQIADFAQAACEAAGKHPFQHLVWGGFFGKLVKIAQGQGHTHAHVAQVDFSLLDQWCATAGVSASVARCVTASHALDILLNTPHGLTAVTSIAHRAAQVLAGFAGRRVNIHLFHLNGTEVVRL